MNDDLVKRLRAKASVRSDDTAAMLAEAADCITALTASLAQAERERDEAEALCAETLAAAGNGVVLMGEFRTKLAASEADIARLRAALQPFADRVFNDNGDITVSGNVSYDDHCRAYFTLRALTTGATK